MARLSILLPPWKGILSFLLWATVPLTIFFCGNTTLAKPLDNVFVGQKINVLMESQQLPLGGQPFTNPLSGLISNGGPQKPLPGDPSPVKGTLKWMLDAISVMQSNYFVIWQAKWPSANDWTAAVMGTQVSATLSALSSTLDLILRHSPPSTAAGGCDNPDSQPRDALAYDNLIDYYFQQTATFWYGEDFFGLRLQAYDDMLWVVLEWLESIKFQDLHSELHYSSYSKTKDTLLKFWHGSQFGVPAAHRSRVFYELASKGWDTSLCAGGMVWSPWLSPYKNAITNELFISASIGMYLYFPGDIISDPMSTKTTSGDDWVSVPRNPVHLEAAITAYNWFKDSNMIGRNGLYADGFHIRGWSEHDPGTGNCDVLNTMLYTYNQGVILSGLRGLWLATGSIAYLDDGHELIGKVMKSTGWPDRHDSEWQGLGRGGVLEDACDSSGTCSQDSQTFKGIFFLHFAEFCRPLRPQEERMLDDFLSRDPNKPKSAKDWESDFDLHQRKCAAYRDWIEHNANAAYMTKDDDGKFGSWWGRRYPDGNLNPTETSILPYDAVDHLNSNVTKSEFGFLQRQSSAAGAAGSPGVSTQHSLHKHKTRQANEPIMLVNAEKHDVNDRGRGRTVETQAGAMAVFRALYQWETSPTLSLRDSSA
ncbi:conserved hypothetical protein [Uncinocarpus reesii 1704]|uniref:Glycosyl hydrolase n=1 Tax=Uncinocarpus reesii (strain UAMH 1704) TaxID=336963 RepID=C4JJE4_UNCRE|nr:uncharacterized protein UREG_01751 [Uncinocarpus reesii 1704]EEP76902.1 conserved hypothetical protein [Uncinocarpus reesii 1704]